MKIFLHERHPLKTAVLWRKVTKDQNGLDKRNPAHAEETGPERGPGP